MRYLMSPGLSRPESAYALSTPGFAVSVLISLSSAKSRRNTESAAPVNVPWQNSVPSPSSARA